MELINLFLSGALVLFGVYSLYQTLKLLREHLEKRKQYLVNNKNCEEKKFYIGWVLFYSICFVIALYTTITIRVLEDELLYRITFLFAAILCLSMGIDAWIKRKVILGSESFYYEKNVYRYKSIASFNPTKSIVKNIEIKMVNGNKVIVPMNISRYIEEAKR